MGKLFEYGYKEKAYCKIPRDKIIDGSKLRVVIMEDAKSYELKDIAQIPFIKDYNPSLHYSHDYKTTRNYLNFFPNNAQVFFVPNTQEGMAWVRDNNIHILSMSMSGCRALDNLEEEVSKNTLIITSAGNNGEDGETKSARDEWWLSVGSAYLNKGYACRSSYSSYGTWATKAMGLDGYRLPETKSILKGTSYGAPFFMAVLSYFYIWYDNKFGKFPTIKEVYDYISVACKDIEEDEYDKQSGYGVLTYNPQAYLNLLNKKETGLKLYENNSVLLIDLLYQINISLRKVTLYDGTSKLLLRNFSDVWELFIDTGIYTKANDKKLYIDGKFKEVENKYYINIDFAKELFGFNYSKENNKIYV